MLTMKRSQTKYSAPKYCAGDVIDYRYNRSTLPNRILINMVYRKSMSNDWMYEVFDERSNSIIYYPESLILASDHSSGAYDVEFVKKMYEDGFRFYRNCKKNSATSDAKNVADKTNVAEVRVYPESYDRNGKIIDGYNSIWIRYSTYITNNGEMITSNVYSDYIRIK